jgi:hypothetical protein
MNRTRAFRPVRRLAGTLAALAATLMAAATAAAPAAFALPEPSIGGGDGTAPPVQTVVGGMPGWQRIRHFAGGLAGLNGVHGVGDQLAGAAKQLADDRCTAQRRPEKLAATSRRTRFGVAVMLAVPLFAATAIVAASPAQNAPVVMTPTPAPAFGHYPSAFIDWKLSPWPPPRSQ